MGGVSISMPVVRPVLMPTKGKGWLKRFLLHFKPRKWELCEDFYFYVPWMEITLKVPKGFIFDGASIPRPLWPLMNPTGILFVGSLFHDYGYRYNKLLKDDGTIVFDKAGKLFFDRLLRDITTYVNDMKCLSYVAWFFLVLFGFIAWYQHRLED